MYLTGYDHDIDVRVGLARKEGRKEFEGRPGTYTYTYT